MARTKNTQPMVKKTRTKTTTKRDLGRKSRPVARKDRLMPVANEGTSRQVGKKDKQKRKSVNTDLGEPPAKRTRTRAVKIREACESSRAQEVQESSSAREVEESSSSREVHETSGARDVHESSSAREREVHDQPAAEVQTWRLNFRTLESSRAFEQEYVARSIVTGRQFDADYLLECGDCELIHNLYEWGWLDFLGLKRHSYTDMVRYFYFNASLQRHDEGGNPIPRTVDKTGFTTFLKGRAVRVTDRDVWRILGEPRSRAMAPVYNKNTYNALGDYRFVFNDPTLQQYVQSNANASRLSFWNRILHFMVCQTLSPRQGSYSVVTKEDLWLMGNILRGTPPNLSALVMAKIKRTIRYNKNPGTNRGLLHGKVVSELIDSKGLPGLNGEKTMLDTVLPFNAKTITQTGFRYDAELQDWVKGANEDQEAEDQVPVNADDEVPVEEDDNENEAEDADLGGHGGGVPVQEAVEPAALMEVMEEVRRTNRNTQRILRGMEMMYTTLTHVVSLIRDLQKVVQHDSQSIPTSSRPFNEEQANTANECEREVEAAATVPSGNEQAEKTASQGTRPTQHHVNSPTADLLADLRLSESPLPTPSRPQTQEPPASNTEKAANSPPSASDQPTATHGKT